MVAVAKVGRPHGLEGVVKIIPFRGCEEKVERTKFATLVGANGEEHPLELGEVKKYNRGRFLGRLNGFRRKEEVEKFQGWVIALR